MSTAKDLIEEHFGSGIEFDELSEQQLKELVAQWLLDGAPGNPFGAEDFFFDGLVGNKELVKPVIDAMSGNSSEFDLMACIAVALRSTLAGLSYKFV